MNRTNEFLRRQNKTFNTLEKIFQDFNIDIGTLYTSIATNEHATEAKIAVAMRLNAVMRGFEATIAQMRDEITRLEQGVEMASNGQLSLYLVPPSKLYSILADIVNVLPPETLMLRPITYDNMYFYYSIIKVHGASKKGGLRLYLEFPLKSANRYYNLSQARALRAP